MPDFYPGQKLVCVNDKHSLPEYKISGLVFGEVYTVANVDPHGRWFSDQDKNIPLWITGAKAAWNGMEWPLSSHRFKPLTSKAISIFRAIAANPNIKIREDA